MIWVVLVILTFGAALGGLFFMLGKRFIAVDRQLKSNLATIGEEAEAKKKVISELSELSLGFVSEEVYEEEGRKLEEFEESVRAEKGRLTITEAELEAIDTRLRELEELKRELEVSNMDAVKELELLRSQERDIAGKNDALKSQLESAMEQLDMLLSMLSTSAAAMEKLTAAKNELTQTEKKCSFYEEGIAEINQKYVMLKKAYDALDIEYAQLYEKQQAAEDG